MYLGATNSNLSDDGAADLLRGIQKLVAGLSCTKIGASLISVFSSISVVLIADDATGAGTLDDGLLAASLAGIIFSAKVSVDGALVAADGLADIISGARKVAKGKAAAKQTAAASPSPLPPDDEDEDPDFGNSKQTAKKFETDTKNYERIVKKQILKDANNCQEDKSLQKFLRKNNNPDIGTDSKGNIWLKSRISGETVNTGLKVNTYIE